MLAQFMSGRWSCAAAALHRTVLSCPDSEVLRPSVSVHQALFSAACLAAALAAEGSELRGQDTGADSERVESPAPAKMLSRTIKPRSLPGARANGDDSGTDLGRGAFCST